MLVVPLSPLWRTLKLGILRLIDWAPFMVRHPALKALGPAYESLED